MKLSRKQRREEARNNKTAFEPQYNGKGVITLEEYNKTNIKKFAKEATTATLKEAKVDSVDSVDTETTTVE